MRFITPLSLLYGCLIVYCVLIYSTNQRLLRASSSELRPLAYDSSSSPNSCSKDKIYDVIVIGAGMSGLSAAKTLKDAGASYIQLERSNRVGGRMKSTNFANYTVEMGANWIKGTGNKVIRTNPIHELAQEFHIDYYDDKYSMAGYEKDSNVRLNKRLVAKMWQELNNAIDCLSFVSDNETKRATRGLNARSALRSKCFWPEPARKSFREAMETVLMEIDYLAPPEKLSVHNFDESSFTDFAPQFNFVKDPRGMQFIAQEFAFSRELMDKIVFATEVVHIGYPEEPNALATVLTRDVSTGSVCALHTKTVIFTPSIGVLKRLEAKGGFSPPLVPSSNTSPLTIDSFVKVFYKFDETFWDTDVNYIVVATERRGECSTWLNYDYYPEKTGGLYPDSGIISCVLDQHVLNQILQETGEQTLTEATARSRLLRPLRATFGDIPEPTNVLITDWNNDPTSYGSWENFSLDGDMNNYHYFFRPRNNKLFISGSGSCFNYWGFMHGAYFAGERDAEWAIRTIAGNHEEPTSPCG